MAQRRTRFGKPGIDLLFGGHIDFAEDAPQLLGQGFALRLVQVKQGHLDAMAGQLPGCGGAQARGPAGDDGGHL